MARIQDEEGEDIPVQAQVQIRALRGCASVVIPCQDQEAGEQACCNPVGVVAASKGWDFLSGP